MICTKLKGADQIPSEAAGKSYSNLFHFRSQSAWSKYCLLHFKHIQIITYGCLVFYDNLSRHPFYLPCLKSEFYLYRKLLPFPFIIQIPYQRRHCKLQHVCIFLIPDRFRFRGTIETLFTVYHGTDFRWITPFVSILWIVTNQTGFVFTHVDFRL